MDDLFKRTQAELHHGRGDFLTAELAICSRYAHLASTMYMAGKSSFADRQITDAEESYATAHRFLTDPKNSQHLTIKTVQESTKKLEALRGMLDQLQRSRKSNNP